MTIEPKGNVLISGAAQRIGRAIAIALAADGWTVGIHYFQSADAAEELCEELNSSGANAYTAGADLSDETAIGKLMDRAAALEPVTCLVNNASVFEHDELDTVTRDSWDIHMAVNLWAPLRLSQAFAAALPDGITGNIVNVVDQRVEHISPGFLSYTVSKAGLWALTQSLALSLAPSIRVNAIGPVRFCRAPAKCGTVRPTGRTDAAGPGCAGHGNCGRSALYTLGDVYDGSVDRAGRRSTPGLGFPGSRGSPVLE